MSDIKTLVQTAQEKKYTDFEQTAKEILANKVSQALQDKGYFARLDQAKGVVSETKTETEPVVETETEPVVETETEPVVETE